MRTIGRLALLLVGLLLMAACSGVPEHSDPVVVGSPPAPGDQLDESNGIQPGGPARDASSDEIVRGFIKALTATDVSYAVAREFLTPDVAEKWSPSEDVTIIDPSNVASPGGTGSTVNFTAKRIARVDARGAYRLDDGAIGYQFELEEIGGQWRITNPPSELFIDSTSFASLYRDANLYFANASGTRLVPDIRYFRTSPQQRANRLVQALIDGPSSALADGVVNELGGPVKLRSAVSHQQNPITVDLTGLGEKSEAQLRIASAQILWTLKDLGTSSARITDDGQPLELSGVGEVQTVNDWDELDPNYFPYTATAYYLDGGALYTETAERVPGPAGSGEYGFTEAAVSMDGTRVAAVSAGSAGPVLRTGVISEQLGLVDLPGTTSLSSPTWGPSSEEFWIVRNSAELVRVSSKGAPRTVVTPSLEGIGPIRTIALSRNGSRLAIVAGPPDQAGRLYLATVVTAADEVSILQPVPLATNLDVSAVAWRDARTLAVLGRSAPGGNVIPYTVLIDDSQRQQLPSPVLAGEPQALAAAPGRPVLCAINQTVLRLQDSAWVSLVSGIGVSGGRPFYPG